MSAQQDHSTANWEGIAPILDGAINQLGEEDRAAILLRFFEQRDFRSVGAVLGTSEDGARMRVNRAVEKLSLLLKRQGVTLSAAALATGLATEAVTAGPAGLATAVASAALTGASGGTTLAVLKIMGLTKTQAGLCRYYRPCCSGAAPCSTPGCGQVA